MDSLLPKSEEVTGLTLCLCGSFDPQVFVSGLALRPIRYEQVSDNSVTVVHKNKAPTKFVAGRKIECDQIKFSVSGPKSIPGVV